MDEWQWLIDLLRKTNKTHMAGLLSLALYLNIDGRGERQSTVAWLRTCVTKK
jgi:hypothetical protein